MKKIIRSSFAALALCLSSSALSSCNSDESLSSECTNKIAFETADVEDNTWDVSVRGTTVSPSDFNAKVSSFRVWGYFSSAASADGATPGGLYVGESATAGAVINGNGSGTWTFANASLERYWPPTNSPLNFQAVAPATDASFTISNSVSNSLPHVVANVTVPTANASQKDIMFAAASSQTQSTNGGKVALAFKHAMSAIRFSAKVSASTISAEIGGISLCNIRSTGKVGYLTDNTLGCSTNATPVATYALGMTSGKALSTTVSDITNGDGTLIMLPQSTTAWSPSVPVSSAGTSTYVALSIKVAYNGVYRIGSSSAYQTVYLPFAAAWEQGKLYTYTLTVGTGTGIYDANGNTLETVPCSFTATSSEWTQENTGVFNPTPAERAPVDLGLPSGTLWAAGNIGAELPWETGLYFAWGETTGYTSAQVTGGERVFDKDTYNAGSAASISADLTLEQDAARANLGGQWQMPSADYYQELIDNCIYTFQPNYGGSGKTCAVFKSMINGNELVIPCTGYYDSTSLSSSAVVYCWSSSWNSSNTAKELCCVVDGTSATSKSSRYYGLNVRAIIPGTKTPGSDKGTENGYKYVDLGLPSGLKWATCNVGTKNPWDYGKYFAWGETKGYFNGEVTSGVRKFDDATYQAGSAASISTNLSPNDGNDAARVNMGGSWRMPTEAEFQELKDNCTVTWMTSYMGKGVAGNLYTSNINGNSVFFPATGYCDEWGSSIKSGSRGQYWLGSWYSESQAYYLLCDKTGTKVYKEDRYYGHSVRGVLPPPAAESTPVDLGLPSGLKWAAGNIGAKNPEDYGLYFAWGETTGYTAEQVTSGVREFSSSVYNAGSAASISTNLSPNDGNDAARANLGENWRMPTQAECNELIDNCTSTWTDDYNGTGVAGRLFTSKVNGNSVFFPAAGYCDDSSVNYRGSYGDYWSASWDSSSLAWYLSFLSGSANLDVEIRCCGQSVRGVCE